MSEWQEAALSEIAEVIMGQSPEGATCNSVGVGTPLLNGPTEFGSHYPVAVQFTTDPRKLSQENDVLFCVRGSTTGRMNWSDKRYAIGRGLAAIRHKKGCAYRHFLKGVIDYNLPDLLAAATGSTFPNVSREQIANLKLDLPGLSEQKAIASVLGALDDKIELNRRMNATLEAMARALFKSWFVDFDPVRAKMEGKQPFGMDTETAALFPSRLVSSELGDIPEGWVPSNLVAEFDITMGQSPPGETYNECGDGLPFYQGRTDFGSRYPSRRIFCTQPNRVAEVGDTLISVRAPVGDINMAFEKCILGRGVAALKHKSKARGYTYYALHSVQPDLKAFEADGTVFGSVNKQDLGKIKIVQANDGLIKQFEAVASDIDEKILTLTIENARLEKTRDYLLHKLISGEIRIPDAEKFVGHIDVNPV